MNNNTESIKRNETKLFLIACLIAVSAWFNGCMNKGFVSDTYTTEFYHVPNLLPENTEELNPVLLVYGDAQADWRIREDFLRRKNWLTWKMAIFPFYEVYWLYNGVSGGVNHIRMVPDAGEVSRKYMRETFYRLILESKADYILNLGDMCANDGRRPQHWELFLKENKFETPLLKEVPFLPVIGNHERYNDKTYGTPNYEAIFDYPPFYRIDFKDYSVFILDSNILLDWRDEIPDDLQDKLFEKWFVSSNPENPSWFEKELKNCSNPFKIVAMHHSPLSFGQHWKDWYKDSYGRNTTDKRKALMKLMVNNGIQAVFSGHDHIYQHNLVTDIPGSIYPDAGIHMIVSSGGGVPMRNLKSKQSVEKIRDIYRNEGYAVENIREEDVHHYCLVQMADDNLTIEVYLVSVGSNKSDELFETITISRNSSF